MSNFVLGGSTSSLILESRLNMGCRLWELPERSVLGSEPGCTELGAGGLDSPYSGPIFCFLMDSPPRELLACTAVLGEATAAHDVLEMVDLGLEF